MTIEIKNLNKNYNQVLAVQNVRNLKKGKSYKCDSIYESKFNLLFTKEDIITGRLIKCI